MRPCSELGASDPAQVEAYTVLIAGIGGQQIANDPGGDRYTRHLEDLLDRFLDHYAGPREAP